MANRWTRKDQAGCRRILLAVSEKNNGWQGIATALGIESRATVQAWHSRGRVPVSQCARIRDLATAGGITCTPGDLNPDARTLEAVNG